jgi:hypothetical protein
MEFMSRSLLSVLATLLLVLAPVFRAIPSPEDGPPINITSPDTATTFAYGTIKNHVLFWDQQRQLLIARVTFTDAETSDGQAQDDEHDFRLPGVGFDAAKGVFYAVSAKGETIPVAHYKKTLFIKSIEVLPNAVVRVEHPHGNVTVYLVAISPNDPAMKHAPDANPDDTHKVDPNSFLQ